MPMKRISHRFLLIISVLAASLSVVSGLSLASNTGRQDANVEAVMLLEAYYNKISGLSAKIRQKNTLRSVGKTQRFEGTLYIKKPGKLRLDYTNDQTIVIDGGVAWLYSKKSEQAIKRTFKDFAHANIPVAFLLGAASVATDFHISGHDPANPLMLELVPKGHGAAIKKIKLSLDEAGRIKLMTIFDRSGNITEIEFHEIKDNPELPDRLFHFLVPPGTEIIDQ